MPSRRDAAILRAFDACQALTDSSKKTLRPYMNKWVGHFQEDEDDPLTYVIEHPEESMKRLMRLRPQPGLHARHHYLNAINALLRHVGSFANNKRYDEVRDVWRAMTSDNWEPVKDRMDSNRPTERQSKGLVRFDDVVTARDKLPYASDERILLGMFTYLPPARGGDYHALRVVTTEGSCDQGNCVVVGPTQVKIVLRKFKTVKRYGVIEHVAPVELADEIRESLRKMPRKYLFHHVGQPDEPYSRSAFSDWTRSKLKAIFGKPVTLTVVRHAFISDTVDFNRPLKELQRLASSMGHTVSTQKRYQHIVTSMSDDDDTTPAK